MDSDIASESRDAAEPAEQNILTDALRNCFSYDLSLF